MNSEVFKAVQGSGGRKGTPARYGGRGGQREALDRQLQKLQKTADELARATQPNQWMLDIDDMPTPEDVGLPAFKVPLYRRESGPTDIADVMMEETRKATITQAAKARAGLNWEMEILLMEKEHAARVRAYSRAASRMLVSGIKWALSNVALATMVYFAFKGEGLWKVNAVIAFLTFGAGLIGWAYNALMASIATPTVVRTSSSKPVAAPVSSEQRSTSPTVAQPMQTEPGVYEPAPSTTMAGRGFELDPRKRRG